MKPIEPFTTQLAVRVSDINYGGHLGNDRVLSLFHEARVRWLASLGWSELDIEGIGIIQTEATIKYRGQAHLGDLLRCSVQVTDGQRRGFTLGYELTRPADSAVIARGSTTLRFFDYTKQALAQVSEETLSRLRG